MKTNKDIRQIEIMNLINEREFISIKELYQILGRSQMTIRRDINKLVEYNKVHYINGLVIKKDDSISEKKYHIDLAKDSYFQDKDRIGKYAASLVKTGDVINIDVGTTIIHMIKYLPDNMDIVVICNSLNVLQELRKKNIHNIVFIGGVYYESTQSFGSAECTSLIKNYRITKSFISAAGFSTKFGVTCANMYEVPYKKTVMQCSKEKILLIDSSKYEKVRMAFFSETSDFTEIVTNALFSDEDLILLNKNNTNVTIV